MSEFEELRTKFNQDYSACEFARDQANEDMRFIMVPGGMWENFLEQGYENKPRMEYDMVSGSVDAYMGEWSSSQLSPKFKAEKGSDEEAEQIGGVFRAAWRDKGGIIAMKNAVMEQAICGFGAIRINTRYIDNYEVDDDKKDICFTSVYGAYSSIVFDSNAKEQDKSDAKYVFVIHEYTHQAFKEQWPDHEIASSYAKDDRREFNWNSPKVVFVIEAYEVIEKVIRVSVFINESGNKIYATDKELKDELFAQELNLGGYKKTRFKKIKRRHVEKSILGSDGFIEQPRKIHGKILPIIPVYGHRSVVDGQEVYYGLIRKRKDPQRVLNMQVSNLAEIAATSVKETPIFAPQQVQGLQRRWSEAHLSKKNYQLLNPLYDKKGNVITAGPVGTMKPSQIDPATQGLIQFSSEHIRETSQGAPQDTTDPNTSGKAILAVQTRVDRQTYSMMDDVGIAIKRIGEAFISIAEEIFLDNRMVSTISEDGYQETQVQLNRQEVGADGFINLTNVFKKNKLKVYAQVGPTYESRRRESIEFMKEILQILPEGDTRQDAIISSIVNEVQGVGLDAIKKINRQKMLISGLVEPKDEEEIQIIKQAAQGQDQPSPTDQLLQSQTALNMAKAESEQYGNMKKVADAQLNEAKKQEILNEIGAQQQNVLKEQLVTDLLTKQGSV